MKGIVGLFMFMIGGSCLDSEGAIWWLFATMTLVGLLLLVSSESEIERRLHYAEKRKR